VSLLGDSERDRLLQADAGFYSLDRSEVEGHIGTIGAILDLMSSLLPDFVYAATVPFLGQEEARRLSRQGRALCREGGVGEQ